MLNFGAINRVRGVYKRLLPASASSPALPTTNTPTMPPKRKAAPKRETSSEPELPVSPPPKKSRHASVSGSPEACDDEYISPPPSPGGTLAEADHTFHVFRSKRSKYPPRWFLSESNTPCGVFGTAAAANQHAKQLFEDDRREQAARPPDPETLQMNMIMRQFGMRNDPIFGGGNSEITTLETDKHGLVQCERDYGRGFASYAIEVNVKARRYDESAEGKAWVLWVKGEMTGVHGSAVAAKKAVERERAKMKEEGALKKHSMAKEGLQVKVGKEAIIEAVKWDIMT